MKTTLLFLFWFCIAATDSFAATPPLSEPRFVFLIDTSASMGRKQAATLRTIRALVASGFNGQINPGERFAIWTFADNLHHDLFPPQQWVAREPKLLAEVAAQLILSEPHKGSSDLEKVFRQALKTLPKASRVTLIVMSDRPLQGTPFDRELAHFYSHQAAAIAREKKAFVTSVAFDAGLPVSFTTAITGGAVELPQTITSVEDDVPARLALKPSAPLKPILAAPETNTVSAAQDAIPKIAAVNVNDREVRPTAAVPLEQTPVQPSKPPLSVSERSPEAPKPVESTTALEKSTETKISPPPEKVIPVQEPARTIEKPAREISQQPTIALEPSPVAPAESSEAHAPEKKQTEPSPIIAETEETNSVAEPVPIEKAVATESLFGIANLAYFATAFAILAWIAWRIAARPSARESRSLISRSMDPPR